MKKYFLLFIIFFYCQSYAADVVFNSTPDGAEIEIQHPETLKTVKIGVTPFKINLNELLSRFSDGNSFFVTLKKKGYTPYRLAVTNSTGNNDININTILQLSIDVDEIKRIDILMLALFEVQRLVRQKNYSLAQQKLAEVEKEYPNYSVVHDMMGGIHYLKKDFTKALAYYRKAYDLNPDNYESLKMKSYLEKILKDGSEK